MQDIPPCTSLVNGFPDRKQELEAGAFALAQLRSGFALASGLGRFIVSSTTRLGQNTRLLDFTLKLFQRCLKGEIGVDDGPGHGDYQSGRLHCAERSSGD